MKIDADCPFRSADAMLELMAKETDATFIEIHAEATAEKNAIGWYLDGRTAAVLRTHTHIPTADARVLPRGTAFQTDVGMTGPYASSLGRDIQPVIARFLDGMPRKFGIAEGDVRLCGAIFDVTDGKATTIQPVMEMGE